MNEFEELIVKYMEWKREEMPHYTDYNHTRGDDVATALLEAYADGRSIDAVIKTNPTVRQYWQKMEQEQLRRQQAAEKARLKELARAEILAKLTPEEIEAFGFNKTKGRKK
jgi:hypothetical protein